MINIELAREAYEIDDIRRALRYAVKAKVGVTTEQKAIMQKGLRCLQHKQFFESHYGDIKPFVYNAITVLRTVLCIDTSAELDDSYNKITVFSIINVGTVFKVHNTKEQFKEYRFIKIKPSSAHNYNAYCLTNSKYIVIPESSRCIPICRDMDTLNKLKENEENKSWVKYQRKT